ncbi:RAD55 family ATPase [Ramlibacter rhizophilus]|uniref:non-specific serine/threonine protein kinase n=1 Tax=Ramlibacter rhizophilus TaxID=1781167 RepID=A0A4Z0BND3_9BURK|nr:ATPase domain-containing protein [Ramlibacter rhizophilus]TFY99564.1 serine/threonine protein kinase [Ramlibacter rhizophilus]
MSTGHLAPLQRVSSGIGGLDEITGGGFLEAGVYILQGVPGAGKTILANHIAYRHAAAGGHVVYVTLLAESHARLLQHMQSFEFFDGAAIPERVYYVSAFNALRTEGLAGVVRLLHSEMRARHATLLVLDGLLLAASAAESEQSLKIFVSDVQAYATLSGCTVLMLTSDDADRHVSAEQTMVDGILLLRDRAVGPVRQRNIEVVKFRGSRTLRGNHTFQIGPQGIVIYPRLEAAKRQSPGAAIVPVGVSTGVAGIDRMLDIGGFPQGCVAVLAGPSGSGKTTLALHFAACSSERERGLWFSFYESPELLRSMAQRLNLRGAPALHTPAVHFLWNALGESSLDELATRLLEGVAAKGAKRVVVDGLGAFLTAPGFAERGAAFLASLMNELRRLGATTVLTMEEQEQASMVLPVQITTLSAVADTVLRLRLTEDQQVRRHMWVGKSRLVRCDLRVRELALGAQGVDVVEAPSLAS